MPRYRIDDSGEIVSDYFYRLETHWYESSDDAIPGSIYRTIPQSWPFYCVHDASIAYRTDRYCTRDRTHLRRSSPIARARLDVVGEALGPIVPYDEATFISADVNRQIQESDLKGTESVRCQIVSWNGKPQRPPTTEPAIYALVFPGADLARKWKVAPVDWPNKCPFCGHGPIICPACGYPVGQNCEKCGRTFALHAEHFPEESKSPDSEILWLDLVPKKDIVLDASKWDGNDFCSGIACPIATRRAIDFLASLGAKPFLATPLRTYVGSCTPEQRERLEEARRPVRKNRKKGER